MAVALRTSGSTQGGASSTLVEFTTPSSVVAGDVWVCSATFRGGSGVTISAVPAAFTLQIRKDHTTGTTNVTTVVYTYVCLGTETASQANWQSITISSSAKSVTVVTPFSGVNTTTPITGTVVVGTGTTSATTTSLAAISANNAVYVVAGLQGGTSIPGLPSGSVHGALTTCGSIATSGGNSATNVGINTAYALGTESSQTYTSSGSSSTYAIIAVQLNVAVSYPADFGTLYTSNYGGSNVSVIDLGSFTVSSTLTPGANPIAIASDPNNGFIYCCNNSSNSVSKIQVNNLTASAPSDSVGASPYGIAVDSANRYAYAANNGGPSVSQIDLSTFATVGTLTVGSNAIGIAVDPACTFCYVCNYAGGTITKIDLSNFTVAGTLATGSYPYGIDIDSTGTYAYVSNSAGANIVKVNLSTFALVGSALSVGSSPRGIVIDSNNTYAYVANFSSNTVSQINLSTFTVSGTVTVGTQPFSVEIDNSNTFVYVANQGDSTVSKIYISTLSVVGAALAVGTNPYGMTVSPKTFMPLQTHFSNIAVARASFF